MESKQKEPHPNVYDYLPEFGAAIRAISLSHERIPVPVVPDADRLTAVP